MEKTARQDGAERVQLHLALPYKIEPREDPRVRVYLERGYRILELQRVTDDEVLITLASADTRD